MLFPSIQASQSWRLPVSELHSLYVEESGNPDGIPVVFLHGGPGGSCDAGHRRFFDPTHYRIILFDQRGAGKSRPHASIEENTTWHLVEDMERIREHLEIDRWVLFGGSWGSTLALAYAQKHTERVLGLVLRGIFLGRDKDVDWFFRGEVARIYPEAWQRFVELIPEDERDDLISAYYDRLTSENEIVRMAAAKAWSIWEGSALSLLPNEKISEHFGDPYVALSIARIECHYFKHHCFLEPDQLLDSCDSLAEVPGFIVHGRYDMVCPIDQATLLQQAWPSAELRIVPDAGHAATEPGISKALVQCTNEMYDMLK